MRFLAFTSRNQKEIVRDPISSLLGIALPLMLLVLFTILGRSAPVDVFKVENITPGMIVFGFSFLTMFSAGLIAQDKKSAFLLRLFASPLSAKDYIIGYTLPLVPLALLQSIACITTAFVLGMPISATVILAIVVLIPQAILSIFVGLLFGSVLSGNQVSGVGSMYVTFSSLFGGAWMDLNMVGGVFKSISYALPFAHSIDAARAALAGDYAAILPHLWWSIGYAVVIFVLAVLAFRKKMQ